MQDLIGEIRAAMKRDERGGRSLYKLAQDAGLRYSVVHRFARGERLGISLVTAAKLLAALGYELRIGKRGR